MIQDRITCYNERVKLLTNFVNTIGLGLLGFAVIRPLTESPPEVTLLSAWWGFVGLLLHILAHYMLGYIRKEVPE